MLVAQFEFIGFPLRYLFPQLLFIKISVIVDIFPSGYCLSLYGFSLSIYRLSQLGFPLPCPPLVVRANETYSEAKRQFSARNRDVPMNAQSPHKWWSTLKSAVFSLSLSMPPLVGGGGLVCESVGKADLLSDHFDGKQSRESVDLSLTCHPSPSLTSFAFRSSEVRHLLLDLDPYGGSDPLGMFWPPILV